MKIADHGFVLDLLTNRIWCALHHQEVRLELVLTPVYSRQPNKPLDGVTIRVYTCSVTLSPDSENLPVVPTIQLMNKMLLRH